MSVDAPWSFGNEMVTFTPKSQGHRVRLGASLQEIAGSCRKLPAFRTFLRFFEELCEETWLLRIILVPLAVLSLWNTLEGNLNMLTASSP